MSNEINKALARSVDKIIDKSINSINKFLNKICMPAAIEYGLLLQDKVKFWRAKNTVKMLQKTQEILNEQNMLEKNIQAPPFLVYKIIENGSWCNEDEIQNMWAGLLASSCTEKGNDDSNLIFINILSQLSSIEVKLLNFICQKSPLNTDSMGLVTGDYFKSTKEELFTICEIYDMQRIDRELDHLNALGLILGSFGFDQDGNEISPSIAFLSAEGLGINLYVRSQGTIKTPAEFFNI